MGLWEVLEAVLPPEKGYACQTCSSLSPSIEMQCPCGWQLQFCARCFGDDNPRHRQKIRAEVAGHVVTCFQGDAFRRFAQDLNADIRK